MDNLPTYGVLGAHLSFRQALNAMAKYVHLCLLCCNLMLASLSSSYYHSGCSPPPPFRQCTRKVWCNGSMLPTLHIIISTTPPPPRVSPPLHPKTSCGSPLHGAPVPVFTGGGAQRWGLMLSPTDQRRGRSRKRKSLITKEQPLSRQKSTHQFQLRGCIPLQNFCRPVSLDQHDPVLDVLQKIADHHVHTVRFHGTAGLALQDGFISFQLLRVSVCVREKEHKRTEERRRRRSRRKMAWCVSKATPCPWITSKLWERQRFKEVELAPKFRGSSHLCHPAPTNRNMRGQCHHREGN